jgi:diguanylate cyclase (GGDEF)-like protein
VPKWAGVLVGALLVPLVAVIDRATGYEVNLSIFYLIPVLLVTWASGIRWGALVALAAACAWSVMDLAAGHVYSTVWIPVWNAIAQFGGLLIGAVILNMLSVAVRRLSDLALRDPLTGLHNARSFYSHFDHEIARHSRTVLPLTVAYLDLDRFKLVNDSLGHAAGDDLLRAAGTLLAGVLRDVDVVARLGGDEFGVLMPETGPETASVALSRVHAVLSDQMRVSAPGVEGAGVTIGAVVYEQPPESPDHAVRVADRLMYEGKDSGGGVVRLALWSRSGLVEWDQADSLHPRLISQTPVGQKQAAQVLP